MEQVFINLIDNAIKHTPADTPIDIDARQDDASLEVDGRNGDRAEAPAKRRWYER